MDSDAEDKRIQGFIDEGNFHAAVNLAISAVNECRRSGEQPCVDHFLETIKGIASTMERKFGSK